MRVDCDSANAEVWRIVLRPEREGAPTALSTAGLARLGEILERADADDRCRLLVIEGGGDSFCTGLDLGTFATGDRQEVESGVEAFSVTLERLAACRQVVVAAVDGDALGGGLGLAAAADWLIATGEARFGLPEAVFGLVPAIVLPVLLERLPPQKVRRLALGAERIDAEEALAIGLADRVVASREELGEAVDHVARQTLRLEPGAVGRLKALARRVPELPRDEAIAAGRDETLAARSRADVVQGIRDFLDGHAPPWFARYRRGGDR